MLSGVKWLIGRMIGRQTFIIIIATKCTHYTGINVVALVGFNESSEGALNSGAALNLGALAGFANYLHTHRPS